MNRPNRLGIALTRSALAVITLAAASAGAQGVPDKRIPPSVMLEVRMVQSEFDAALADDCAPDRCYTKGCVYADHITLDQARTTSLPGLPAEEGPGAVAAQDYLTRAKCSFAYENNIEKSDVQKLARRLRKRLSHGWLSVSVTPSSLDPIPASLADSAPPEEKEEEDKDDADVAPLPPEEWTAEVALHELWDELRPHFWWMLLIFFLTIALLMTIWAARRLGAPSMEDKMLEAQLKNGVGVPPPPEPETEPAETESDGPSPEVEDAFAEEQEQIWNERLERMDDNDEDIISRLLREWLRNGDFPTLARALFVFGDKVSASFDDAPDVALRKVEFANYFRDVDEAALPSRAKFFRQLNQHAMASLLLSQDDVRLYRSLREDFGASGVSELMQELPDRYGALLFALIGDEQQRDVAPVLPAQTRVNISDELLSSTRIALNESAYLAMCVEAVRTGASLPAPPDATSREHGAPVDSAGALSALLTHMGSAERTALFEGALARNAGNIPGWYEDIVFNHMLSALPEEMRNDLLLEVDIRGLSAWLQMQPSAWRTAFTSELSGTLQNALYQNARASSRADLLRYAKRGHEGLVRAFQGAYARRGLRFVDLAG